MKRAATAVFALILAGGLTASPAIAKDIPRQGLTVEEVVAWLQESGYKAEVKKDKDGDRYVGSAAEGVAFDIYLDDCKDKRCGSLEFTAGFDLKGGLPGGAAKVNEWNQTKRWLRASVDSDNDPWATMDVSVTPGRTYDALDDDFATWRSLLVAYKSFIGW